MNSINNLSENDGLFTPSKKHEAMALLAFPKAFQNEKLQVKYIYAQCIIKGQIHLDDIALLELIIAREN